MLERDSARDQVVDVLEHFGVQEHDPDLRVLRGCTVLGGYGFPWPAGTTCALATSSFGVLIVPPEDHEPMCLAYDQIAAFEIAGPGRVRSGGGFIGGGFGLEGAAEGMIVAGVLNALTTRSSVTTILNLTATGGEVIFHHGERTPEELRVFLSPLAGRVAARRGAAAPQADPSDDPIERLAKLKELKEAGLLTDEEFEAARARAARDLSWALRARVCASGTNRAGFAMVDRRCARPGRAPPR
jgi:hypothetical protein